MLEPFARVRRRRSSGPRASVRRRAARETGLLRGGILFTSELPLVRRRELERLLYFNDNQHKVEAPLREALRRFGSPSMVPDGRRVRFSVSLVPGVQTLYALDVSRRFHPLVAAVIYMREDAETLTLVYLAVHEDYADGGAHESKLLAPLLLGILQGSAAKTKGIRWLRLSYHPRDLRISVRRGSPGA